MKCFKCAHYGPDTRTCDVLRVDVNRLDSALGVEKCKRFEDAQKYVWVRLKEEELKELCEKIDEDLYPVLDTLLGALEHGKRVYGNGFDAEGPKNDR